uniref:Uncharacterized protein n=1 Tax=Ditylenchus dipsaci TaxID=166011 RepID=A0A915EFU3_9BILA
MACETCLELCPGHPAVVRLLKDIREYEKRSDFSQFRTLFVYRLRIPSNIILTAMDSESSRSTSMKMLWNAFVRMSGSFRELFDGLVKAKEVALHNVKGVDDALFSHALNNFSCFRNSWTLDLCDHLQKSDKPLVIEVGALLSFLHNYIDRPRCLIIDYRSLDIEIEMLWDMLVERFMRETEKRPFRLEVRCPHKLLKPKDRYKRNLKTSEMLEIRTDLPNVFAGEPDVSKVTYGFILGVRRLKL